MRTCLTTPQGHIVVNNCHICHYKNASRQRVTPPVQVAQVHIPARTLASQTQVQSQRPIARCVCASSNSGNQSSDIGNDEDSVVPQPSQNVLDSREDHQQQPQQQQQQQLPTRARDDIQLEYLRVQAAKLQALEQYQQLMAQYEAPASSSSSKQPKSSAAAGADQQEQQGEGTPGDIPVLDAALLVAKHAHPDLDPQTVRQQLDDLAAEVAASLPEGVRYPLRVVKEINRVLFEVHGFKGNEEDYYSPNNSYINKVLETKRGIPISLSLVYIEVAARLGLPMAGVNLPAHFMIRPQVEGMELLVDAYHGGELTALEDAEEVLGKLIGYQVKLDPRFVRGDTPYFSSRQLLLRLLNNLRQIYMTLNMPEEALWIVRFMRATAPKGTLTELQRDEGMCLYGLGRFHEASEVLVDYLNTAPDNGDVNVVKAILQRIKERAAAAVSRDDSRSRSGDGD